MQSAKQFVEQFGARKLAIIGGSGLAVVLAMGMLVSQVSGGGQKGFLYTDLDPQSAQIITEKLRGEGVDFELSPDGTAVQVPVDKIPELRMSLASEQLGGKIGYEVLDGEEPFGTSASRQKLNETRAIEGELAKSIRSMQRVRDARVHLVMPERKLFSDDERPATAAITVKTTGRLASEQVDAIRYLVSSSVPELNPDRISIVDQTGALLARAGDGGLSNGALDERRHSMEDRYRQDVETMLERIVGQGGVRAQVAVDLNSEQVKEESDLFDPDRQVIAKQTSVETNDESDERSSSGEASVSTQLPENQGGAADAGDSNRRKAGETSEETTYDNSRVHKTSINPGGDIKRLTVSVMVDGVYTQGADGKPVYAARSAQEIERLTRLVQNAVGYNEERGDSVVVESMAFKATEVPEAEGVGIFSEVNWLSFLPMLILAVVALVGMFLMSRNLRRRAPAAIEGPVGEPILLEPANVDVANLTPEMRDLLARAAAGDEEATKEFARLQMSSTQQIEQEMDVAHVNGRLKANVLKRVGDVVNESPSDAAAVVRAWMAQ